VAIQQLRGALQVGVADELPRTARHSGADGVAEDAACSHAQPDCEGAAPEAHERPRAGRYEARRHREEDVQREQRDDRGDHDSCRERATRQPLSKDRKRPAKEQKWDEYRRHQHREDNDPAH
jgi:hypothetical protein